MNRGTLALRVLLCFLSTITILNFSYMLINWLYYEVPPNNYRSGRFQNSILFATTISSGMVINLGTVIQTLVELKYKNALIDFKYTECLLCGCFLLLLSQTHSSVSEIIIERINNNLTSSTVSNFIATPITTFMSFASVLIFHLVTLRNKGGRRSFGRTVSDESPPEKERKTINYVTFVEGTACIGKTTCCDVSFDYTRYLEECELYVRKGEYMFIQSLYEANMYADMVLQICDEYDKCHGEPFANEREARVDKCCNFLGFSWKREYMARYRFFDRSPFSQLGYCLLFHLNGAVTEPEEFKLRFDTLVSTNETFCNEIRRVFRKWEHLIQRLMPAVKVSFAWYGSKDPRKTATLMSCRQGIDCQLGTRNLTYYTANQNYVFRRLQEISGVGGYTEVEILNRKIMIDYLS